MKLTNHVCKLLLIVLPIVAGISCAADRNDTTQDSIQSITSVEQFNSIIENAGNRLLAFNLYADWCMPCHVLAPTLAEIATENRAKLSIYKVDTDQFPQITAAFGVTGIPFVVFVKNKKAIYALIGVQPKDSYSKIIETYSDSTMEQTKPRGRRVVGIQIDTKKLIPDCNMVPSFKSKQHFKLETLRNYPITTQQRTYAISSIDDLESTSRLSFRVPNR